MKKKPERKVSFPEALGLLAVVIVVIFLNAMKFSIGTGLSVLGVAMIVRPMPWWCCASPGTI